MRTHSTNLAPATDSGRPPATAAVRQVRFVVDYGMVSHGLAPLYVDGQPTALESWGFSDHVLRRLARLSALYDRQIDLDDPLHPEQQLSDRDRREFNALLPFVISELELVLGEEWQIVVDASLL